MISLDGPVVTASGLKDELAVVTHASDCLPCNDQVVIPIVQLLIFLWHSLLRFDMIHPLYIR